LWFPKILVLKTALKAKAKNPLDNLSHPVKIQSSLPCLGVSPIKICTLLEGRMRVDIPKMILKVLQGDSCALWRCLSGIFIAHTKDSH
jgi:hypothetical protein